MKISILHLSDIHVRKSTDRVLAFPDSISRVFHSSSLSDSTALVLVSGDLAYSGQEAEYELFGRFIKAINDGIKSKFDKTYFFACPGNHDCDFSGPAAARSALVASVQQNPDEAEEQDIQKQCMAVQKSFYKWLSDFTGNDVQIALHNEHTVQVGTESVQIHAFNTAWMSTLKEVPGKHVFPSLKAEGQFEFHTVSIGILHHPYNWTSPDLYRRFRRQIEQRCDIVLIGHEHFPEGYSRIDYAENSSVQYIHGGALQGHGEEDVSFNVLNIDTSEKSIEEITYTLTGESWEKSKQTARTFGKNPARKSSSLVLSADFEEMLRGHELTLTHPNLKRGRMSFDSLWTDPSFQELQSGPSDIDDAPISFSQLVKNVSECEFSIILGEEKSGRTSVLRQLYWSMAKSSKLPLILDAKKFPNSKESRINKEIENAICDQYLCDVDTDYYAGKCAGRTLLIDNWSASKLNPKGKASLLRVLRHKFDAVCVASDETGDFEWLEIADQHPGIKDVRLFQILGLNERQRELLVRQWLSFGQEDTLSQLELNQRTVLVSRAISAALGKKVMPKFPVTVLMLLQQLELGRELDTAVMNGSHAYLYESLITNALVQHVSGFDVGSVKKYLSVVAWGIYLNGSEPLNDCQRASAETEFQDDFDVRYDFSQLRSKLMRAGLVKINDAAISFSYPYHYYYFLAAYIDDHFDEVLSSGEVEKIVSRIYSEEAANVLIFLSHLNSRDELVEALRRRANALFENHAEFEFGSHDRLERMLFTELAAIDFEEKGAMDLRADQDREDSEDGSEPGSVVEMTEDEYKKVETDVLNFNCSFKTLEVLGQILRNNAGTSYGKTKLELSNDCYSLALRTLEATISLIDDLFDTFLEIFVEGLLSNTELSNWEKKARARRVLTVWTERWVYTVLRKLARSIGSEQLKVTYEKLLSTRPQSLATRLVDTAIKLDSFRSFPEKEIDELLQDIRPADILPRSVLRHLVVNRFYMLDAERHQRRKYSEKLGLSGKKLQVIAAQRDR